MFANSRMSSSDVIMSKGSVLSAPPAELSEAEYAAEDNLTEMEREHIFRVLRETNGGSVRRRWSDFETGAQTHDSAIDDQASRYPFARIPKRGDRDLWPAVIGKALAPISQADRVSAEPRAIGRAAMQSQCDC
jgi:hypothetical protein